MTKTVLKIIGIGATVLGFAASAVSNWVGEKRQHDTIVEEVSKHFEEQK